MGRSGLPLKQGGGLAHTTNHNLLDLGAHACMPLQGESETLNLRPAELETRLRIAATWVLVPCTAVLTRERLLWSPCWLNDEASRPRLWPRRMPVRRPCQDDQCGRIQPGKLMSCLHEDEVAGTSQVSRNQGSSLHGLADRRTPGAAPCTSACANALPRRALGGSTRACRSLLTDQISARSLLGTPHMRPQYWDAVVTKAHRTKHPPGVIFLHKHHAVDRKPQ
jgi:hypothetical protein